MEHALLPRTINDMPAHARVWVYKSFEPLNEEQQRQVRVQGAVFTASWAAHGAALDACVDVLNDHMIVVAVDEQQAMASGCSIDKSVRFIQQMEHDLRLNLTDRMVVIHEKEGSLAACRAQQVPELLKIGLLTADTLIFDDLVTTKADLLARWRVPLKDTWLVRYL